METTETNRRLLILANHLDTVPEARFDYDVYADVDVHESPLDKPECGTQGCALGHATTIPEFRDLGLVLTQWFPGACVHVEVKSESGKAIGYFDRTIDIRAAEVFFGISHLDACYLFLPGKDEPRNNPSFVANKIRTFVANNV